MKQIVTFVGFMALSFVFAHTSVAQGRSTPVSNEVVMMKGGKAMISRDGRMSELKADFTSANGNIFKPNGTVVLNTGVATTLKEGQAMNFDGKILGEAPQQKAKPAATMQKTK